MASNEYIRPVKNLNWQPFNKKYGNTIIMMVLSAMKMNYITFSYRQLDNKLFENITIM